MRAFLFVPAARPSAQLFLCTPPSPALASPALLPCTNSPSTLTPTFVPSPLQELADTWHILNPPSERARANHIHLVAALSSAAKLAPTLLAKQDPSAEHARLTGCAFNLFKREGRNRRMCS